MNEIKIKQIEMHHHREELRRSLLTSSHWQTKQRGIVLLWKGGEEIMQKNKFTTAGIAFSIVAVVIVSAFTLLPSNTKTAYAEEIAQKSYDAVATLSPEQQEALKEKVQMDNPKDLLERAKKAKDLKVLTYEQFIAKHPAVPGGPLELKGLNFLQFTDTNGSVVTLGVDPKTNLPVLVTAMRENPDKSSKKPGEKGISVQSGEGNVQGFSAKSAGGTTVESTVNSDGTGTVTVNGKDYVLPKGMDFSKEPPQVKVEGSDVYLNGEKLTPVK